MPVDLKIAEQRVRQFLAAADAETAPVDAIVSWLNHERIAVLNVAGPRASKRAEIYRVTFDLLDRIAAHSSGSPA